MVGLDVTHQILMQKADADHMSCGRWPTRPAELAADLLDFAVERTAAQGGAGAPIHDAYAVVAVTHPEFFGGTTQRVAIELDGTHTRGMTVVDARRPAGPADAGHVVLRDVDAPAVIDRIVAAVAGGGR